MDCPGACAGLGDRLPLCPPASPRRMMNRSRPFYSVAVTLLALTAFFARAASLDTQSLWRDEVDALCYAFEFPQLIARALTPEAAGDLYTPCACPPPPVVLSEAPGESTLPRLAQMLGSMIRQNGPLYYLMLRGWIALAGQSEYAMRFFALVFGVLCVPLIYALGRRLFSPSVGLFAALLITFSPYLTWYSQEVRMYTMVPALAMLIIYALRRAIEGEGWLWWAIQSVATTLAFYSHILAALLIPVQILLYFVWWPRARKQWIGALVSLAFLTLPYLPLVLWQAPLAFKARETGFPSYTLAQMAEILLNGWSLGITGWGWSWGMWLTGLLALWGFLSFLILPSLSPPLSEGRARRTRNRLALLSWLVTPLLAVWLISLRQPLFTDRYLTWAAPAFYLLVALGLASFRRLGNWGHWVAILLVGLILVVSGNNIWRQATDLLKADFRAVAAYVADYSTPNEPIAHQITGKEYPFKYYLPLIMSERHTRDELIVFQIPHARYSFDYYFAAGEYSWAEGLYTNHRAPDGAYLMSEQEAAFRMEEMTAGYSTIWLLATESPMWDERGLVQTWLEVNGERVDEAHFMRVDVYRYVR